MNYSRPTSFVIILLIISSMLWASAFGPDNGYTGAPGEDDCSICHNSYPINSPGGSLTISSPDNYNPGETIEIVVTLTYDEGMALSGFEVTVLDTNNQPVGQMQILDDIRTQLSVDSTGRVYIKQTFSGTDYQSLHVASSWNFAWTAPLVDAGPVTFYAAGNAADGLNLMFGDYIYTNSATLNLPGASCCIGITGNVDGDITEQIDIADLVYFVHYSFGNPSGPEPPCLEEANVDGAGGIDIADLVYLVNYMFGTPSGPSPVGCP